MGGGGGIIGDIGHVFQDIGNTVDHAFHDIENFGEHIFHDIGRELYKVEHFVVHTVDDIWYNLSGQKDRDMRELEDIKNKIDAEANLIKDRQLRLEHKFFLENAFKYVDKRAIKDYVNVYNDLIRQYNDKANDIKDHQPDGFLGGLIEFIPSVVSAFVYSIKDYLETGNAKYIKEAVEIAVLVVVIVVSVISFQPELTITTVGAVLAIISSVLALDAMVNDSAILGGVFQILDLVLNKILGLDKYMNTDVFNKDSKYYEETLQWFRMALTIAAIIVNVYTLAISPTPAAGTTAGELAAKQSALAAKISEITSAKIVGDLTLSQIFEAYQLANSIGSMVDALKLKKELEDKLDQTKNELEQRIAHNNRMKMQASYADAEYIANQVDLVYSEYALQMSEQNMTDVYDPEGTVAMNTRFRPTPKYSFGFEDIFNEDIKAGSDMYVYNVLWKT
jgi:hypothetical protein